MTSNHPSQLPRLFGRITAFSRDEARLDARLRRLDERASALTRDESPSSGRLVELRVESEQLLSAMKRHFVAEEANSYFGVLMAEAPSTCATIIELCAQHAEMLRLLEATVQACASDVPEPALIETIAQRVSRLASMLELHEQVESQLMQTYLTGSAGDDR
jgi:hypothetical protein